MKLLRHFWNVFSQLIFLGEHDLVGVQNTGLLFFSTNVHIWAEVTELHRLLVSEQVKAGRNMAGLIPMESQRLILDHMAELLGRNLAAHLASIQLRGSFFSDFSFVLVHRCFWFANSKL